MDIARWPIEYLFGERSSENLLVIQLNRQPLFSAFCRVVFAANETDLTKSPIERLFCFSDYDIQD